MCNPNTDTSNILQFDLYCPLLIFAHCCHNDAIASLKINPNPISYHPLLPAKGFSAALIILFPTWVLSLHLLFST